MVSLIVVVLDGVIWVNLRQFSQEIKEHHIRATQNMPHN